MLSVLVLLHSVGWVAVLCDSGRSLRIDVPSPPSAASSRLKSSLQAVPGTFEPISPVVVDSGEIRAFVWFLGVSSILCGFLVGLLSPPGLWPRAKSLLSTPERKQLAVLLAASTWVSLMVLSGGSGGDVVLRSLPALLFVGVLFGGLAAAREATVSATGSGMRRP